MRGAIQNAIGPDCRRLATLWSKGTLMMFLALCCPCMSTLATIRRETNGWKWPVFVFVYMTVLAYLGAVAVNQVGRIFGG